MNPLGYVSRALLILAGSLAGFAVVSFVSMGYRETALLCLVTVMIPVSMVVYEYMTSGMK